MSARTRVETTVWLEASARFDAHPTSNIVHIMDDGVLVTLYPEDEAALRRLAATLIEAADRFAEARKRDEERRSARGAHP